MEGHWRHRAPFTKIRAQRSIFLSFLSSPNFLSFLSNPFLVCIFFRCFVFFLTQSRFKFQANMLYKLPRITRGHSMTNRERLIHLWTIQSRSPDPDQTRISRDYTSVSAQYRPNTASFPTQRGILRPFRNVWPANSTSPAT